MTVWQAGMRCVFVRSYGPFPGSEQYAFPVEGRVYTVRDVVISITFGEQCLRLHEISNAHMVGRVVPYAGMGLMRLDSEPAFDADRFRPLAESRLDQFRKLLAPVDRVPA